ncbi:hypothetical protein BELL_0397g00130 [Botrytis elliptica]|uniref:Uncharacterized protein n=1 Tax=Botrytis elliptica TaxID=278938 RepID=A0A4Z1JH47_9HELO|nr:hypothetical protein BELL_0397g00130 [Botrytis elliptica]
MGEADVPGENFAESEESTVQNVVAAICLGLSNSENWALSHSATKTPRIWSIWSTLWGISKHNKTRRHRSKKSLISQLQFWMPLKYRVARITNLGHGSVLDFDVLYHTHGNTLFLSREVYRDGLNYDEEEMRLAE